MNVQQLHDYIFYLLAKKQQNDRPTIELIIQITNELIMLE